MLEAQIFAKLMNLSPDDFNDRSPVTLNGGRVMPEQDHLIAAILTAGLMAQRPIGQSAMKPRHINTTSSHPKSAR